MGSLVCVWPDAYKKAPTQPTRFCASQLGRLGLRFDEIRTEFLGASACLGFPLRTRARNLDAFRRNRPRVGVRSRYRALMELVHA